VNAEVKAGPVHEADTGAGTRVAFGLGANREQPLEMLHAACRRLEQAGVRGLRMSPVFRTMPENCVPGTPDFFNAVAIGRWKGPPAALRAVCHDIEVAMGRPAAHSSREARVIDIDLLLFGEQVVSTPALRIPHPGVYTRLFVLIPFAEIAPDWPVPPEGIAVRELCRRCVERVGDAEARRRVRPL